MSYRAPRIYWRVVENCLRPAEPNYNSLFWGRKPVIDAASWLWVAIAAGVLAVLYGVFSMMSILRLPAGNPRMQEIAAAIQAGAKAYLNRQYTTIFIIGIKQNKTHREANNRATTSNKAESTDKTRLTGYIGMNISVRANVR